MVMSLNCLLLGSTSFGEVILVPVGDNNDINGQQIEVNDLQIGHLKFLIQKAFGLGNHSNVDLWMVDIAYENEDQLKLVTTKDDIKNILSGEKLLPTDSVKECFQELTMNKKNLHVIVQPTAPISATAGPSQQGIAQDSLEWSIQMSNEDTVVLNVDVILSRFSELFTRCCHEKLKLPIFKPNETHPYYDAIRDLQIPSNPKYKQRPFLLMNDLPTINGNDGLTDTTVLEELSDIKEVMIVLGTSGSGKTRTLIELLCKKYGFYFTGLVNENPGSGDLHMMIEHIFPRLKKSLTQNDAYAMRYSKCLLFARIYTLNYILKNHGKISSYNWAILQLCPNVFFSGIFEEITLEFRKAPEYFLDNEIRKLINYILSIVKQKKLPVILDEAQELIDRFHNKFTSTTKEDETRPLYSVVIRTFTMFSGLCVIPSGTGLTMKSVLNITGSHVMKGSTWKHEQLIVIKNGFDSVDRLKNFLLKFRFPCDDHLNIIQWFVGRVRFATTFIEEWLENNYDTNRLFIKFKENYTNPDSDTSIMVKIVNRTKNDIIRQGISENLLKEGASGVDLLSLLERAVLKCWYNGISSIIIKEETALELFEYGVALLHKDDFSKLRISISEPFVIESALQYFKKYNDISLFVLDQMSNVDFSPSSLGILWENLIPNAIMKLFQDRDVHDIFKKPLPYNNWKIYEPPNGKTFVLATHSTTDYNLPNFLEKPISPFFYPENTAGPDVVTVVCPVDLDERYLVLVQYKFREKNPSDVLLTTDPKKFYHKRQLKKGEVAKLLKGQIYKESYDKVTKLIDEKYDGIFRIFISYPATVKLQEEVEVEGVEVEEMKVDNAVEEWVAIIDASNCDRIFDKKHIDMFNELKRPRKREGDWQLDLNSSNKKSKS